jgi:chemotaxis protein CheD
VSSTGELITTVLGSCIAVCLYDHKLQIGGMNHFLLASCKQRKPFGTIGKYGNLAIPDLLKKLEQKNGNLKNIVAKIIGGASILAVSNLNKVPNDNIVGARQILLELSIPIVGQDIGGRQGRKIIFNTKSGQVTINDSKII